jgi:F420-non-reducing hydrogenase iron-sulfur subunit
VERLKKMLLTVSLSPERLTFYNLSAAQGPRWAEMCTEFTEKIGKLGPSPIRMALRKKQATRQPESPAQK